MHAKLTSSLLRDALSGAREIYVSGCSAELPHLPELLDEAGIRGTVTGIVSPVLNTRSYAAPALERRTRTFFLNQDLRRDLAAGWVDFCPWSYSRILRWMQAAPRFDAAVVMVSPADAAGHHSLGTQVDFLADFIDRVGVLIAVVNPQLPRTCGPFTIHRSRFAHVFGCDQPLLQVPVATGEPDPISGTVARHVAALVPNGATLQVGMGRISQAVTGALASHRGLRIHSGLIDDSILRLEEAGVLDRDVPVVAGVAIGTPELYAAIHDNPRFAFCPVSHTHAERVIAATPNFIAVNGGLEVDLFGQLNSEAGAGRLIASPGGLPDFMGGARRSKGGLAIIALRAKPGRKGRGGIVPRLDSPSLVSLPRSEIDMVVTENGTADLRDTSLDQRAEALIAIADPGERTALEDEWRQMRGRALT